MRTISCLITLVLCAAAADTNTLIEALRRPEATLYEKARACQMLGESGQAEAVPVLAALLSDEKLSAYARSGLEGIPDPAAAAALRAALKSATGERRKGVINSLAVLRDPAATKALAALARDATSGVAPEAMLALGRIATDDAIRTLQEHLSSETRALAAPALLIAADLRLRDDDRSTAVALFDAVRSANVPAVFRIAGTRGAIVARGEKSVDLIRNILQSDEREMRHAALLALRSLEPSDHLANALSGEMETARPEMQAQLLEALGDLKSARALEAIRRKAGSSNPQVRDAAMRALIKAGRTEDADLMLRKLIEEGGGAPASAALLGLTHLQSRALDRTIIARLANATSLNTRLALIRLLDARSPMEGAEVLLRQAGDPDPRIGLAALQALRSVAAPTHLPALVKLTRSFRDGERRAAAESVLAYAATRYPGDPRAGEILLPELVSSSEDLDKASWIRTLIVAGYEQAIPTIMQSARSANNWLVNVVVTELGTWPGPAPMEELLGLAESATSPAVRRKALASAVQLASNAGNAQTTATGVVAGWFQRAATLATTTEDQQLVLSGLGRWKNLESIRLLLPWLDRQEFKTDAALAITLAAAGPVSEGPEHEALKPVLDKLEGVGGQVVADRLMLLRRAVAASGSSVR